MIQLVRLIMTRDYIHFLPIRKWIDSSSILMVTIAGHLLRKNCPFEVRCVCNTPKLQSGNVYWVDRVIFRKGTKLFFVVNGVVYDHNYFELV